ncbi:MAG: archaeosortase/exosortase family protein [Verrucomicrobiota bacterium]
MPEPADPIANKAPEPKVDWPIMLATYLGAALVFYPLARWVFKATESSEQLLHALIVLAAAGLFLITEKRQRLRLVLDHDRSSLILLASSFLLVSTTLLFPYPSEDSGVNMLKAVILLIAFGLTLASLVRFTLGPEVSRTARGLIVAFTIFMLLALVLPLLDWPLREVAGKLSLNALGLIGYGGKLTLAYTPAPELILSIKGRPFIVAAECNGFGLLSSSILLTILLVIYRRLKALDVGLVLLLAIITAFVGNTLRIMVIILLAPNVENYMLMHEIVGLIFFYGTLGFLWWFIYGFNKGKSLAGPVKS